MKNNHKNYLRSIRLQTGLTQGDVAYLLGLKSQDHVSNLEKRKCVPSIRIILGCRILYKATLDAMIPTYMKDIEELVSERADELKSKLEKRSRTPLLTQRINSLQRIANIRN